MRPSQVNAWHTPKTPMPGLAGPLRSTWRISLQLCSPQPQPRLPDSSPRGVLSSRKVCVLWSLPCRLNAPRAVHPPAGPYLSLFPSCPPLTVFPSDEFSEPRMPGSREPWWISTSDIPIGKRGAPHSPLGLVCFLHVELKVFLFIACDIIRWHLFHELLFL